jgi:hypothetical protein
MTIDEVLARWQTLLEAAPYSYAQAPEPFSFDLLPAQGLDHAYCLDAALDETDDGFHYTVFELHDVTLHLVEKVQRDADAAQVVLSRACSSLTSTLTRDSDSSVVFSADVTAWEIRPPGPDDDHLVARMTLRVDLERSL